MAEASVIELRAGHGEPRQISLTPGSVLDPTSVGQTAMWRIEGAGVLDVHGYLYFDGKALFVQSADDDAPMMVNRHRIARAWTEVRMPSTIELGEVQLVYRIDTSVFEDADQTVAQPLENSFDEPKTVRYDPNRHRISAPRPAAGTPAEGVSAAQQKFVPNGGAFSNQGPPQGEVDESTRYKPLDLQTDRPSQPALIPGAQLPGSGPGADVTRSQPLAQPQGMAPAGAGGAYDPAAMAQQQGYAPAGALPPGMVGVGVTPPHAGAAPMGPGVGQAWGAPPGGMAMPGQPAMPGQAGAQTGSAVTSPLAKLKTEFMSFSPVKRAALVLMVIALPVGGLLLFSEDEQAPAPKPKPAASASASASVMAAANTVAAVNSGATSNVVNTPPAASAPPSAPAQASAAPPAGSPPPASGGKPGAPDPAASVVGKLPSELPPLMQAIPMPAKKSTERLAADAVVEGKFGEAAKLYDQLAQQNPGNPAYKEAARIMREASKGSPGQ
ncbi:hypothetical protein LZC95_07120 [Pendulispora brunnea]|uniref:Uncharacterized protein n=1 Tax=Pendulispora brunnea TaxID=2905690 RepID=A0ABZ2KEX3_9BACT